MLHELQTRVSRALLRRDPAGLEGLFRSDTISWQQRFAVHQGTFDGFLTDVLKAAYPVVCRLVGESFFRAAAGIFLRRDPPREPQLWAYGGGFPGFLEAFEPAGTLPYLADVARVEWARLEAYFAAEAPPLDPALLAGLAPDEAAALPLALHPAARLLTLGHRGHAVWLAHQDASGRVAPVDWRGREAVLVWRPAAAVLSEAISPGTAAFLAAAGKRAPLAACAEAALMANPATDLQALLTDLLARGVFCWDPSAQT